MGEEMGDCPAPYLQGVIAAFSVIRGSLLETRKLNTMQPVRVGKAETGLFSQAGTLLCPVLNICSSAVPGVSGPFSFLSATTSLSLKQRPFCVLLLSYLGEFLSPQLQSLQCLSNYSPCLYPCLS